MVNICKRKTNGNMSKVIFVDVAVWVIEWKIVPENVPLSIEKVIME